MFRGHNSIGEEITLRSSLEKICYEILVEKKIDFLYERKYPNSNLKYDFYLPTYGIYIEICGFPENEEYMKRMYYKRDTFGSVLLFKKDIRTFLETLT